MNSGQEISKRLNELLNQYLVYRKKHLTVYKCQHNALFYITRTSDKNERSID